MFRIEFAPLKRLFFENEILRDEFRLFSSPKRCVLEAQSLHQFQFVNGRRLATLANVRTRRGVRVSHTLQCPAAKGGAYAFWAYFASLVDVLEAGVISVCWLSESRLSKVTHETGASQLTTPCQRVRALPAHSLR